MTTTTTVDPMKPKFRSPCGHDADAVHLMAGVQVVTYCCRCQRAFESAIRAPSA